MKLAIREPINALTHFIGFVLSFIGFWALLYKSIAAGNAFYVISSVVFSAGLMGLYLSSSIYHGKISTDRIIQRLRKLDHAMIFFLIAATYTPVCLISLQGLLGYIMLASIWILAIAGMFLKAFVTHVPRWISTGLYLFLGWVSVSVIKPLYASMEPAGVYLLIAGGLFYTVGALIYGTKSERLRIGSFGHHEIFHLLILLG
ncbi:MAG TPA: hemolysin, partial [Eubacteriaceae bacterium]|nr:hemolysin [Eubacteriaceae bacterium]